MQITLTNLGAVTPDEAEETLQTVTDFLKGLNLEKLITLLLLLAGCLVVMKLVLRLTDRAFLRLELERSLPEDEEEIFSYLSSGICKGVGPATVRVILWMITLCIVLDYVGVPMTSLVAVLSVIGLAVSLAIQGTLSNLAGGIQVLLSKPFKAGDYVEAGGISGGTGLHQAVYRGQQGDLRAQRTDFRGKDHQLQYGRAEESRSHLQRLL